MSLLFRSLSFARSTCRHYAPSTTKSRNFSTSKNSTINRLPTLLYAASLGLAATFALAPTTISLDSAVHDSPAEETVVDPATSIVFPATIRVPAKVTIPPLSLVGVGVRTVSFLGIKVYSVGFYADLADPNLKISRDMNPEDKIDQIVRNAACVIRIVPTRSTSYTHLRDAFMRALQGRLMIGRKEGTISEEQEQSTASPMRKLKSLFPNSPLAKHTPLDIYLSPPTPGRPRALVFRDLGSIENDWVSTEFVLNYFEGDGPSPALKKSVLQHLKSFET